MGEFNDVLGQLTVFESLGVDEVKELAAVSSERLFAVDEVVYCEGEPAGGFFVVLDGAVELVAGFSGGVERVFGTIRSGQVLGLLSVIDNGARPATARAAETTRTLAVEGSAITGLRDSNPVIWAKIVSGLGSQLAAQTRTIVEQYRQNIEWSLEVSGCAGINLNRLLTDSVEVEIELISGRSVTGVILAIEDDAPGHDVLLRSDDGRLRIIPYRSVVQIVAARADFEAALVE